MSADGDGRKNVLLLQWEKIQQSLAQLTGLSLTTLVQGGRVVAEAGDVDLCRLMVGSGNGGSRCGETCLTEAAQALRENAPRLFRCRAGLECFAVPVRVKGRAVAAILGGRILEKAPDPAFFQQLAREHGLEEGKVLRAVGSLHIGNARNLGRVADLVRQIAEALFEGARRHQTAQRRLALLNSLFRLSTDLSPEKDPHEIHALVVNTVSILFDVDGACLFLRHGDGGRFRLAGVFGSAETHCRNLQLDEGTELVADVLERHSFRLCDDYHLLLGSGFPEQVRKAALFPLLFGEKVGGILLVVNTSIDEEAARMIFAFCSQASTAVQNTVLRRELQERTGETSRLLAIQSRFSAVLDRDKLLEAIFEETTRLTHAGQASLMLLNRKTNELTVKLAQGEYSPVIKEVSLGYGNGIAGTVVQSGEPLLVTDIERDPRFGRRRRPRYRSKSFLLMPISVGGRVVGVLNFTDKEEGVFTAGDLEGLSSVLSHASIALHRSELHARAKELQKISTTDALTNLLNRRYFQQRSQEEIVRAQRHDHPLSLIMVDLDDFKMYNDRHGHLAGDNLLISLAGVLLHTVRSIDVVSRFGGEEFAILSPETAAAEALAVAERVRRTVRKHPFLFGGEQVRGAVSISAGVASYPEQAEGLQELIDNADRALYRAKRAGKNRVLLYKPT